MAGVAYAKRPVECEFLPTDSAFALIVLLIAGEKLVNLCGKLAFLLRVIFLNPSPMQHLRADVIGAVLHLAAFQR